MRRFSISFADSSVELPLGDSILGRDKSCRLRFADLRVSRHHLHVRVSESGATVEDLDSTNGTKINGAVLEGRQALVHGDLIELGGTTRLEVVVSLGEPFLAGTDTLESDTLLLHTADLVAGALPTAELARVDTLSVPLEGTALAAVRSGASLHAERRRHVRVASSAPVSYDSESLKLDAHVRDLSEGGVFVVSELLDQVGTYCSMTIDLDGTRPLRMSGVVRHVVLSGATRAHPPGMGIEFTESSLAL